MSDEAPKTKALFPTRYGHFHTAVTRQRIYLLAALPDAEWQRWLPQLIAVELPLGQALYEPGNTLGHAYFPTTANVCALTNTGLKKVAGYGQRTDPCHKA